MSERAFPNITHENVFWFNVHVFCDSFVDILNGIGEAAKGSEQGVLLHDPFILAKSWGLKKSLKVAFGGWVEQNR